MNAEIQAINATSIRTVSILLVLTTVLVKKGSLGMDFRVQVDFNID